MRKFLVEEVLVGLRVVDDTPMGRGGDGGRGEEVRHWLEHKSGPADNVVGFVAIDDNHAESFIMWLPAGHFVQTEMFNPARKTADEFDPVVEGLTQQRAEEAY